MDVTSEVDETMVEGEEALDVVVKVMILVVDNKVPGFSVGV